MNTLPLRNESGFSMIELLVVIAIIAILAAIAIPQFAEYRKRSFEAEVKSDMRNAVIAQEAYFAANSTYFNGTLSAGNPPGFNNSTGVTISASVTGSRSFSLSAAHASCGTVIWTFDSVNNQVAGGACP